MKNEKPLSDLYQRYVQGKLSKRDLEGMVFLYLLKNQDRYRVYGRRQYRWDEYLSWLYPRLSRAIELYRDIGSSFDAYVNTLIHSTVKEYRRREAEHLTTEYACWKARAEEMTAGEASPEYSGGMEGVSIPKDVKPRQVLILLLKSYNFASGEFVERVAGQIGMEPARIENMIDQIRERRSRYDAEILGLRERIHCQYYRCLVYQRRMNSAQPGTGCHRVMRERFERARKRLESMYRRLGKIRMGPSNRMISEVTGIPKGTIDSSLFMVKNRFAADPPGAGTPLQERGGAGYGGAYGAET